MAELPTEFGKTLRCCYSCRLVKTFGQVRRLVALKREQGMQGPGDVRTRLLLQ